MEIDILNSLVTGAIWRAEQLDVRNLPSAAQAWAEVSALEEKLAEAIVATDPEGRIARRGAVRAALKAGDYVRAQLLTELYMSDKAAPKTLKTALQELLEDDERAMASRFCYAAKEHRVHEARELARRFRKVGAFGLAAA